MKSIKKFCRCIIQFIRIYYIEIFFVEYLLYLLLYFLRYNSGNFGDALVFNFLFIAVTFLTELITIDSIFQSKNLMKKFTKQIEDFENKHKECKKEKILFKENEKLALYELLFEDKEISLKRFLGYAFICFVHMAILLFICLKFFLKAGKVEWSLFTNAYPYSVFLVYFIQAKMDNKVEKMYVEMKNRGKKKRF